MKSTTSAKANDREFDPINLEQKWVESLPEYTGPSKVHALQIQHIESYGPGGATRDKKGQKSAPHQSLASSPNSTPAVPATERPQPEDYGEHAAGRLTPVDKSYAPFEVDEAYMRDNRPHTGGYYLVYETGAEGFEAPEVFTQRYTRVRDLDAEKKAREKSDKDQAAAAEQTAKDAADAEKAAKKK